MKWDREVSAQNHPSNLPCYLASFSILKEKKIQIVAYGITTVMTQAADKEWERKSSCCISAYKSLW